MLRREPLSATIEGLTILDTRMSLVFYSGRWTDPEKQSDEFYVARQRSAPE